MGVQGWNRRDWQGKWEKKLHILGLEEQVNILEASFFSVSDGNYKYTERRNWDHSNFLSVYL